MGTVKRFENVFNDSSVFIRRTLVTHGEKKGIERKKKLYESVKLTQEQEKQIQDFFVKYYGKRIPTKWHRLYTSYTGAFCYDYFPEYLFSSLLEPKTNPYREAEYLDDKNLLPILFGNVGGVHVPQTFVSSIRGVLRDGKSHIISLDDAEGIVKGLDSYVIKKTVDTNSGKDVQIVREPVDDLKALFQKFGRDFVVQEVIIQSPDLMKINPSSVNTFRVITYICDDQIWTCPMVLRLGRNGADKDNIHYGGFCVGVKEDGTLKKTGYSEFGDSFDAHPDTGFSFERYGIARAEKLLELAKELHARVPGMGIISWDLTIDNEGIPTIIEMNTTGQSSWFNQMVNGEPLFGDNTPQMLRMIRKG